VEKISRRVVDLRELLAKANAAAGMVEKTQRVIDGYGLTIYVRDSGRADDVRMVRRSLKNNSTTLRFALHLLSFRAEFLETGSYLSSNR